MKNLFLFAAFIMLPGFFLSAQKVKFGKVDKKILKKQFSELDSSAAAEVIYDYGKHDISFSEAQGTFTRTFKAHQRIKVYDKDRFGDDANIEIPLYSGSSGDNITGVKCFVYNLQDGKVNKTKLKRSDIYEDKASEFRRVVKFAVPQIQDGTVFEFKYTIGSKRYWDISTWYLQSKYPVLQSKFITIVPDLFIFKTHINGYENINLAKEEVSATTRYTFSKNVTEWTASNIPAFKKEPYSANPKEYHNSIENELITIDFPDGRKEYFAQSWDDIDKDLRESHNFYEKIKSIGILKKTAEEITNEEMTDEQKADTIFKYVQKHTKWNGYAGKFATQSTRKTLGGEKGSSADINLLLTAMFRNAGLEACPVILSTRGNGRIYEHRPTADKFNYVIVRLKIGDKDVYADATDDYLPLGVLPRRTLNGTARIICDKHALNFKLPPTGTYNRSINCQVKVEPDFLNVTKMVINKSYAAHSIRKKVKDAGSKENYLKELSDDFEDELNEDIKLENIKDAKKPVVQKYNFKTDRFHNKAGNMLFFTPLLDEAATKPLFTLDERKYPVDFASPVSENVIMQITVPADYKISELPESIKLVLPDNAGSYQLLFRQVGQIIQVAKKFSINKPVFMYDEYAGLKQLYDEIAKKEAEKIVLEKK